MAIKLNLLAEAKAAEELRRRDPVKRCALGGVFVVVLFLVWWSAKLAQYMVAEGNLARVKTEIDQHTNEYSAVMANKNIISEAQKKLDALQQLSTNRFLQGNLLNALQQTAIIPGVQLTRLSVSQSYSSSPGTPATTDGDRTIPGTPASVSVKTVVSLDARDASANPGDGVGSFKEALLQQPYFKTMLNQTNAVKLTSLSPPQMGPDGKMYVQFSLECDYPDHLYTSK